MGKETPEYQGALKGDEGMRTMQVFLRRDAYKHVQTVIIQRSYLSAQVCEANTSPSIIEAFLQLVFLNMTTHSTHHQPLRSERLAGLFPAPPEHNKQPKLSTGPALADKCVFADTMTGSQRDAQKKNTFKFRKKEMLLLCAVNYQKCDQISTITDEPLLRPFISVIPTGIFTRDEQAQPED